MTDVIEYLIWSPDRETFIATMAALKNPLTGQSLATLDEASGKLIPSEGVGIDEIGPITKPAVLDGEGNEVTPTEIVPGHHVNMVAYDRLAALLTAGMPAEGDVFQRTRIPSLLGQMTEQDSEVGEPPGLVGTSGVKIYDPASVNRRVRVWA